MNENKEAGRSGVTLYKSAVKLHGNIFRQTGNIRSAALEGSVMNADQIFGMAKAVEESIEVAFGKAEHDIQPEIGRKFHKPRDNVMEVFSKIRSTPLSTITAFIGLMTLGMPAHAANRNVESVLASQSDLSMFYQALVNTGVADELNPNTEYTIFAPTNAAFTAIQPRAYPCFYSAQCRVEIAAILRNHIVPRNETIGALSKWGGDIPTIGNRELYVEEAYKNQYTVESRGVLHQNQGDKVSLYPIDGVIASQQELAQFRIQPVADNTGTVTEKTVITYRTPTPYPLPSGEYAIPGGAPTATSAVYIGPDGLPDSTTQTTTATNTTTTD